MRIASILLLVALATGCTSTRLTLKNFDEDMPSNLVKRYQATQADYADEAFSFCLPLLCASNGHVAVTDKGIHAEKFDGALLFGLIYGRYRGSDFGPLPSSEGDKSG